MLTGRRLPSSVPILLAAAFLGACAGGRRMDEADGRAHTGYAGRTLAVLLPQGAGSEAQGDAAFADSLRAAYPGAPSDPAGAVLARAFASAFWPGFAAGLDPVAAVRVPDSAPPAPEDRRIPVPAGDARSRDVPVASVPDSAWLAAQGTAADMVLAFGPLSASTVSVERSAFQYGGRMRITYLVLEGGYVLWDYARKRPLAQGRFHSQVAYRSVPDGPIWAKAFDAARRSVADAMPFGRP